jgi:hypothetical protein
VDIHFANLGTTTGFLIITNAYIIVSLNYKLVQLFGFYFKLFYNCNRINYCVSLETTQKPPKNNDHSYAGNASKGRGLALCCERGLGGFLSGCRLDLRLIFLQLLK